MKKLFFILAIIFLISCQVEKPKTLKPSFLIGKWIRLNDKDNVTTYETWQKDFTGIGLTLKGKDTTFFEEMKIINQNDSLFLAVSGLNETPTLFKFTAQTDTSFVCENSNNEFPKKIKYYIENSQLKAVVSSDDFRIDFIFERVKK